MPDREMTMIERVARALLKNDGFLESEEISWRQYVPMAIVAIEALREPTEAMLEEGPGEPYMEKHVWARMIDAALKEHEGAS